MATKFSLFLIGNSEGNKIFSWRSTSTGGKPRFVSGPYKMVSLFMRTLLTPKGDILGRPDEGTEFYNLLGGNVGDAVELQSRVQDILDDCFSQVVSMQQRSAATRALDPNEILASYAIIDMFIASDGSKTSVKVALTNRAGESVSGLIPFTSALV